MQTMYIPILQKYHNCATIISIFHYLNMLTPYSYTLLSIITDMVMWYDDVSKRQNNDTLM